MADTNKVIVTQRDDTPPIPVVLPTPPGTADIEVVPMRWWTQVLIRTLRSYVQNVLGYLLAAGVGVGAAHAAIAVFAATTGIEVPPETRTFIEVLIAALFSGIGPAVISLIQNALEILVKLDSAFPQFRA